MAVLDRDRVPGAGRTGSPANARGPGLAAGALTGFALALVTSTAIVANRLARGDSWVAITTSLVAAVAAIVVLATTCRWFFEAPDADARRPERLRPIARAMLAQAAGVTAGVLLVHLALRGSPFGGEAWLSERPPQLVNDFAAAFGALALIWACAWQPVGALASVLAVAITVAYALTAPRWHLDAWGAAVLHGARQPISVQLAVLAQLACTAVGVSTFHRRSTRDPRDLDVA